MKKLDKKFFDELEKGISKVEYEQFYELLKKVEKTSMYSKLEDDAWSPESEGPIAFPDPVSFEYLRKALRKERERKIIKQENAEADKRERLAVEKERKEKERKEKVQTLVNKGLSIEDAGMAVKELIQ
jgi:hypothetical protein